MTLESLIEEIEKIRKKADEDNIQYNQSSSYWIGYYDAIGELLEFIEDNK